MEQNAVLEQVNQFWSILDEMSQNNPEAYKTFIERHLREGADCLSPPQPHCCLRTHLQRPEKGILYVNLCGWKQVPAPTSPTQPIPVYGGELEMVNEERESYSIVEVAFNPKVLQMAEGHKQKEEQMHLLALSFVQQRYKLSLSEQFVVTRNKSKGSVQKMKCRLMPQHRDKSSTSTNSQTEPAPSLLQQISSLRIEETKEDSTIQLSVGQEGAQARPGLIEVITSTELCKPQQPKHQITLCSESSDSSKILKLHVELPGVCSVSQCHLSITQVDVLLEVEDMYYLHLRFPEPVNEDTCHATFHKKKHVLVVTAAIL